MSLRTADLGTVVGVWAHPDDEAYLMAGTAMTALAEGSRVVCVTATDGEAGESSDEARWPRSELARIRREELAASLALVGVHQHHCLELADGSLRDVPLQRGADLVTSIIDDVRPDTILTFGSDGMTGHPDHVAIGSWAALAARTVTGGPRVLAATNTPDWYAQWPEMTAAVFPAGGPSTDREDVTLAVELPPDLLARKVEALRAQPSQTARVIDAMGPDAFAAWVAMECWVTRPPDDSC